MSFPTDERDEHLAEVEQITKAIMERIRGATFNDAATALELLAEVLEQRQVPEYSAEVRRAAQEAIAVDISIARNSARRLREVAYPR